VSGAAGSNECPAGSVRIETGAACRTAAAAAGKTVYEGFLDPFVVSYDYLPRGCYFVASINHVYFNTHPVGGAGQSNFRLLCAAVTTGAPPPHADAHARAIYLSFYRPSSFP
jgi:hypothetical protein